MRRQNSSNRHVPIAARNAARVEIRQEPEDRRGFVTPGRVDDFNTYHHRFLSPMSEVEVRSEMTTTEQLIADVTGLHTRCMRPPHTDYGQGGKTDENGNPAPTTDTVLKVMRDLDYMVVLVDLEPEDWNYASTDSHYVQNWDPQRVLDAVTAAATTSNTPILHLQHGTKYTEKSIQMVQRVIDIYRENSWQIISLDECLGQPLYRH